jgi:protein translocase SecG subunit
MTQEEVLAGIQIVISVLLILSVLMQQRGGGAGSILGGSSLSGSGEYYRTRRGFEKFLLYFTMILGVLLVVTSFLYYFL